MKKLSLTVWDTSHNATCFKSNDAFDGDARELDGKRTRVSPRALGSGPARNVKWKTCTTSESSRQDVMIS